MKYTYLAVAALIAAFNPGTAAWAQSTNTKSAPAEFPPASYKAPQYVDSRGCVYVRAGVDGNTTWIPRLSRQRKHVCGMTPTKVAGTTSAPVRTGVEQITLDPVKSDEPEVKVASARVTPKVRPTAVRVDPVVEAPKTVTSTPRKSAKVRGASERSKPLPVKKAAPATRTRVTSAPTQTVATTSLTRPTPAAPRAKSSGKLGAPVPSTDLAGSTRVVPLHVYKELQTRGKVVVPDGYRLAWEDDRLNRRRAEGSLRGRDRMNLVWTNTVPRRLIDRSSGKDVTAKVALVYPYVNRTVQSRELGEVTLMSRNGKLVKRIRRNVEAPKAVAEQAKVKTVVATKSRNAVEAPVKPVRASVQRAKPAANSGRYVQVGLFGVAGNATATASKLQRLGLPVRISKMNRGSKTLRSVMAGPFADASALESALKAVRGAGFKDAYLR